MLEMGTSGLMSGDGKRGGFNVSTRVRPRLYNDGLTLLRYFLTAGKRSEGRHARTMGTQRCPVATDRTDLATEATL
jgi:hypothetical protein